MEANNKLRTMVEGNGAVKKILIADDDHTTHIKFTKFLNNNGFEVLNAYDGAEAYSLAQENLPDILLLDISMPKMDGRDVCKKLKSNPDTSQIWIIMITSKDQHNDRMLGFSVGADEYIEKPCSIYYLERAIKTLLHKYSINYAPNSVAQPLSSEPSSISKA